MLRETHTGPNMPSVEENAEAERVAREGDMVHLSTLIDSSHSTVAYHENALADERVRLGALIGAKLALTQLLKELAGEHYE